MYDLRNLRSRAGDTVNVINKLYQTLGDKYIEKKQVKFWNPMVVVWQGYVALTIRVIIVGLTEEMTLEGREAVRQMGVEKPLGGRMRFISDYSYH